MVHATDMVDMFVDDGDDGSELRPFQMWTGFHIDLLEWIASRAGFTYTLHSPSGYGSHCTPVNNGSVPLGRYATSYNCAQDDVIELNRTHVFWSMFYITPYRLNRSTFTAPFFSDGGLTIVVEAARTESLFNEVYKLLLPFEPPVWYGIIVMLVVVSLTMWFIEHPHRGADDVHLADEITKERFEHVARRLKTKRPDATGILTWNAWSAGWPMALHDSLDQITAGGGFTPNTAIAHFYNMGFSLVCFVIGGAYIASLAAILATQSVDLPVESFADLELQQTLGKIGPACTKGSTAYSDWLKQVHPKLQINEQLATYEELDRGMRDGECDAVIDAAVFGEWFASNVLYCDADRHIVGEPLSYGLMDMAIGVRSDLGFVRDALSYWLTELRACSPDDHDGACYHSMNLNMLWENAIGEGACGENHAHAINESLSLSNFAVLFMVVVFSSPIVVVYQVVTDRHCLCARIAGILAKRFGWGTNFDLFDFLVALGDDYWECGGFRFSDFLAIWSDSREFRLKVRPYVADHFLGTDVKTWRRFTASARRIDAEREEIIASQKAFVDRLNAAMANDTDENVGDGERATAPQLNLPSFSDDGDDDTADDDGDDAAAVSERGVARKSSEMTTQSQHIQILLAQQEVLLKRAVSECIDQHHVRVVHQRQKATKARDKKGNIFSKNKKTTKFGRDEKQEDGENVDVVQEEEPNKRRITLAPLQRKPKIAPMG